MESFLHALLNLNKKVVHRKPEENWYRGNLNLINYEEVNSIIKTKIIEKDPFMVARFGSVEIKPLLYYSVLKKENFLKKCRYYVNGDIDYVFSSKYDNYMLEIMCNNAGFFPNDYQMLHRFATLMENDAKELDICGCWLNEFLLSGLFQNDISYCDLGSLEPYDNESPWTKALQGKKVLVVHPFKKSIESQFRRRNLLWANPDILPDFELKTIKAVQSIAGEPTPYKDWFEALNTMKTQMNEVDYDVAIIGCGAYGFPLAAHAKRQGKVAIHLGGPVQILFGIKGKRWDSIPSVAKFYNDYWVRPMTEETPLNMTKVENGCYW